MMTLFSGKRLTGCAVAVGAILTAGMVVAPQAHAADDLPMVGDIRIPMPRVLEDESVPSMGRYEKPGYDGPYEQRPYRPGPYGQGPYAAIPPGYGRAALDARPFLPPTQVVAVLRSAGYSPLGRVTQRGWIYTVAAIDPNGDDGRLIIDARTGRIMRFIPAMEVDAALNNRMAMAYGPPGPPPSVGSGYEQRSGSLTDLRRSPMQPAPVPRAAQRSVPKIASRAPQSAPVAPGHSRPTAASSTVEKTAENKSAAVTVGAASSSPPQPPALKLWPTQAMPDVQTLE